MIAVNDLTKMFKDEQNHTNFTLDQLSFHIEKSEVFGIMGPSGSGKSTLLRLLSGLIIPDSGRVVILDQDISKLSQKELRRIYQKTAFVFQNYHLLYNKTVLNNLLLPFKIKKHQKAETKRKALEILNFVGLSDKANAYPMTLSGGQQQRVAIARALLINPEIIFFDEPTSALDAKTAFEIIRLIKKIKDQLHKTIVIVSHQKEIIQYLCDRALWLEDGKILKLDKVARITDEAFITSNQAWGDLYE